MKGAFEAINEHHEKIEAENISAESNEMIKVNIETKKFLEVLLPALRNEEYFEGEIFQVEGIEHSCLRMLDFHSFDYFMQVEDGTIEGLSVRICSGNWKTFTIRTYTDGAKTDTELKKHRIAMDTNKIRPYWHIQAYMSGNNILSCAFCVKDELINYILSGKKYTVRNTGSEIFVAVDWIDYARAGYQIVRLDIDKKNNLQNTD